MAYLVLARKYRPQTFGEIVGQSHVTRTLANAFSQDRVHHAFLFCGPRGVGKTTAARVLAKALNCEKGPTAEPDGTCSACTTITSGTAVDYYEMDGASNRGIDAIRELTDAVRYQPAVLRKKVYVIDEVHMLTTEAFNALLKTLEEPPPHVTFVMATTEPHKVPNTILSRCQRFDFKLVSATGLVDHITSIFEREEIKIEPGAVGLLARESGGSVRDALSLADQVISYVGDDTISETKVADVLGVADRSLTRKLVTALSQGDVHTALTDADAASARGVDETQIARAIARHLRDLAVIQATSASTKPPAGLINASGDEIERLRQEATAIDASRLRQMFDRIMRACDDLSESGQPRLVLDFALIDVAAQEPVLPLGDLIERLGDLESRLATRGGRASGSGGGATSRAATVPKPQATQPTQPATRARPPEPATRTAPTPAPTPQVTPSTQAKTAPVIAVDDQTLPPIPPPAMPPPPLPTPTAPAAMPASLDSATVQQATAPAPTAQPAAQATPQHATEPAAETEAQPIPFAPTGPMVVGGADMLAAWERIIVALEANRKLALAGLYQNAKVLAFSDERVEVGFPAGSMTAEVAAEADKVAEMTAFLAAQRGREVGFSVKLLSGAELERAPNAKSILEASREAKEVEDRKREGEARRHPITKTVLDTFGAQIKEIKTDV